MRFKIPKPFLLLFLVFCVILFTICRKLPKEMLVSTGEVTGITTNTADATGTVIDLGEGATQHGHCYGTSPNVSVSGSNPKTQLGIPPAGGFTSQLTGLTAGTKYYIKAYITDGTTTAYGDEISFSTEAASVPALTTTAVTAITTTTATSGGNITSDGGASVTARGVCWNTATGPSISNSKTTDGSGTGTFTSNLSGLTPGTTYYLRAYATNSAGTAYGNELTFTTTALSTPTLTTTAISSITQTTASGGGNITNDGGASVTARGVCWGTVTGPTTADNKTSDATGTGSFSSSITGLTPGTTYYVRAYATNSAGTSYGNELSFTTIPGLPVLSTTSVTSITQTTAASGGNITSDGGSSVTFRGVCWSTTAGPTTTSSKTTDGTGSGIFTSNLTGLTANTTYYVRAYAINSAGTAYGNEVSFTTSAAVPVVPSLSTVMVTSITQTTATSGGNITSDGGASVTARGVCWSTTTSPTVGLTTKTSDGSGSGTFASNITGLTANTKYYVRAYATNSVGTAYGDELSFTTSSVAVVVPTLTTTAVSALASTTVNSGGDITSDGGASVTARGVCWNTATNPTIANSKTDNGTGTGTFSSSLTGLNANTTYYVRAYATNSTGTAYGNEVTFTTTIQVTDIDGNIYNTVKIGTQLWMKENLRVTRYNDGSALQLVTDNSTWTDLAAASLLSYCWYNNDGATFKNTYGGLYKWYTVTSGKLCPAGWHVPSDTEWTTLTDYLGGESVAGGKLKETGLTYWNSPNTGATNESGFSALPGGFRGWTGFYGNGEYGSWLSSTEIDSKNFWERNRHYDNSIDGRASGQKICGFSVRCLEGVGSAITYLPPLKTADVTGITSNSATCGGTVLTQGNSTVTALGVCWSTSTNPTITLTTKTNDGTGTGSYTSNLTGLTENTTYYVRAYATNSVGTAYGNEVSFTTNPAIIATLTTTTVTDITGTTATSGGNITSDGGGSITVRGVCWDVTSSPTTGDNRTQDGPGTGTYVSNLTGLIPNTTYYLRAYATNSAGTAYGNELPFSTPKIAPSSTTSAATDITQTSVTLNGIVNANNDATSTYFDYGLTTSYGTIYAAVPSSLSTSTPTAVSTTIPGLVSATTYHFRVWAQNSVGTTYGNDMTFSTLCGGMLTITHTAGDVAPVSKTGNYGTVETNLTGATKCWITKNLGADNQASSATDATEAAAGWYWQFNRKQGFKHDGTTRTPATAWITSIDENSDWISANDPCTILLGTGWRIPTSSEWTNAKSNGGWSNNTDAYGSVLKLHTAGHLVEQTGILNNRGSHEYYNSSTQYNSTNAWFFWSNIGNCGVSFDMTKASGNSIRCLKD